MKDKKAKPVLHGYIEIANESKRKPNKLWIDQGREFYSSVIQKWLEDDEILMYLIHNEGKLIIAKRFVRILKGKIWKKSDN